MLSVGLSVKLLPALASTVILDFRSRRDVSPRYFFFLLDMYMFRNWAASSTKEGSVFLYRGSVCCPVVSVRVYPRCHGVQVAMDSESFVTVLSNIYTKVYRGFLLIQACVAGYALTYVKYS
jgi:hypothetical protein